MSVTATSTPRLRLTDEELVLLGAEHPAVELPFLAGLKESERSVAIAVAYRSLDGHLTAAIDRARTLYRDNVNTARFAIAFSGPGAFILCVLAAAGVAAGFYPRVREYR